MRTRPLAAACVALALFAVVPHARAAEAVEKPSLTIAVAGSATDIDKLAYGIALQRRYFRDAGIAVENLDLLSGSRALQALVGGSVDVVEGSYEHTLRMQALGVKLTCMAVFARYPGIVMMAVGPRKDTIRTGADLAGRKIGISAPGSAMHTFAAAIMKKAGVDPGATSFISVGVGPSAVAAVRTGGELDVLVNVDPVVTDLERSGDARVIVDSRNGEGAATAYGGVYPAGCLLVPHDFIARNPRTAQALTDAMMRSMKWLQSASVDDIVKTVPKGFYHDEAVYRAALEKNLDLFRWDGLVTPAMSETVLEAIALLDPRLKAARIDFSTTYDNTLTTRALAKFK